MKDLLQNKRIIVTGADGGIGGAAAEFFFSQGASVMLTDLPTSRVADRARMLAAQAQGGEVQSIAVDLCQEQEIALLLDQTVSSFGGVDGIFCNAGIGFQQTIADVDAASFDRIMQVNVRSVFLCAKHAARVMKGKGAIVITASRVAHAAYPRMVPYIASKGALLSMTRALAVDLAHLKLRVNAVLPGVTQTPMFDRELAESGDPDKTRRYFEGQSLLEGFVQPDDIAAAAAFLLSDYARNVTGTGLVVDGGCLARVFEGPSPYATVTT